jgi:SAM-dependent methyltransferase
VDYRHGNYLDLELRETFDLILLIFGDFCPLGPNQRRTLLDRAKQWLSPGGQFVFDVSSSAQFESLEESSSYEYAPEGGFWSSDPHFVFTKRFKYRPEMAYLDRYLVLEATRRREFFNWIQCYDPPSLKQELSHGGWGVEEIFGNVAGEAYDPEGHFFAVRAEPKA